VGEIEQVLERFDEADATGSRLGSGNCAGRGEDLCYMPDWDSELQAATELALSMP
jgi:hypothetical protein